MLHASNAFQQFACGPISQLSRAVPGRDLPHLCVVKMRGVRVVAGRTGTYAHALVHTGNRKKRKM